MNISDIINKGLENNDGSYINPEINKDDPNYIEASRLATESRGIDTKELEKYHNYGLNYSPNEDMNMALAYAQSNWKKAGSMLSRMLISEFIGGTISGAADLAQFATIDGPVKLIDTVANAFFDTKNPVAKALGHDGDYSNPISAKIDELREQFNNEVAPIYRRTDKTIDTGAASSDFGWWAESMPSVISSLTLLLPTKGAMKLPKAAKYIKGLIKTDRLVNNAEKAKALTELGKLSRAEKTAVDLNRFQSFIYSPTQLSRMKALGKVGTEAVMMRAMENYQEARQTHKDTYNNAIQHLTSLNDEEYNEWCANNADKLEGVDTSSKVNVAKHIAKQAADRTFALNWANVFFDAIQLKALGNIGKYARKNIKSAGTELAHEASKINFGRASDDIIKLSTGKKIANNLWSGIKGSANLVASELSEGIEEGVNYIAQQEGLTYGKVLLGQENENTLKPWNDRLMTYLSNAEMHESMFWGVMGGIMFGAGGKALNAYSAAKQNKKDVENREKNKINTLDEQGNDFISLFDLTETKAAKETFHRRAQRYNEFQQRIEEIKEGVDPFSAPDENGKKQSITDDIKKDEAIDKAINAFVKDMTLDHMNSGTLNYLVDLVQSDQFDEAIKSLNISSDKNIVDKFMTTIDKVENIYNDELSKINYQIASINKDIKGDKIPFEYVSQLAAINLDKRLQIDNIENKIAKLEKENGESSLDPQVNQTYSVARFVIKADRLRSYYNGLQEDKEKIKNDNTLSEIVKNEHIRRIEFLQQQAVDELKSLQSIEVLDTDGKTKFNVNPLGFIADVIGYHKSVPTTENNNNASATFTKSDDNIVKLYENDFEDMSEEELIKGNKAINKGIAKLLAKDGLYQTDPKLFNNLVDIAELEILKVANQSSLIRNRSQIIDKVDDIHNKYNEARYDIFNQVKDVVLDIHNKYLSNDSQLEQTIIETYFNNKKKALELAKETFTQKDENGVEDAERLIDVLNIVNFTQNSNAKIFNELMSVIEENREKGRREANKVEDKEKEKSSTNLNSISATQNVLMNNSSESTQNAEISQENEQIEPQQETQQSQQTENQSNEEVNKVETKLKYNPTTKAFDTSDSGSSVILSPAKVETFAGELDGFKVTLNGTPDENELLLNDESLFEQEGANFDDNIEKEVVQEPIIDKRGNSYSVLQKGKYKLVDTNTGLQPGETEADKVADEITKQSEEGDTNQSQSTIPSTGSLEEAVIPEVKQLAKIDTATEVKFKEAFGTIFDINDVVEDWDKLAKDFKELIKKIPESTNIDEAAIDSYIADEINAIKPLYDIVHDETMDEDKKLEAMLAMMARLEEKDSINFSDDFKNSIDKFVESYAKQLTVPIVDGKRVVLFRDVLRACNDLYPTSDLSNVIEIYDALANYFMTKEANDKYLILDLDDIKNNKVIDKIQKTSEELNNSIYYNYHRVGIAEFSRNALYREDTNYFKALDELMPGDEVTVRKDENALLVYKGDVVIGMMAIPKIEGRSYFVYTDGVKTSIYKNSNGEYRSELKEIMEYLFTENNNDCHKTIELMERRAVLKKDDENYYDKLNNIINEFFQIPLINVNEADSVIAFKNKNGGDNLFFVEGGVVDRGKVFNYFYKIWNYTNNINATGYDDKIEAMRYNLDDYFEKLYNVYDAAYNWGDKKANVPVIYINDGDLNLLFDESTRATEESLDYNQFKYPSEAIANKSKAKLGIYDNKQKTLHIATRGKISKDLNVNTDKEKYIQQVLILEGKNIATDPNAYHVVKSFNRRLIDDNNDFTNSLLTAVYGLIEHDVQDIINTRNTGDKLKHDEAVNKFLEDIKSIVVVNGEEANGEGIIPLFRFKNGCNLHKQTPISEKFTTKGIEFNIHNGKFTQNLFISYDSNNKNGLFIKRKTENAPIEEKEQRSLIRDVSQTYNDSEYAKYVALILTDYIKNNCIINSDLKGVQLDNDATTINRGFIRKNNGKVSLTINTGNEKTSINKEFDSYSSYILDNDLIKVNTYIGDNGLNFTSRTENQLANQTLYIDLNSLPVERIVNEEKLKDLSEAKIDKELRDELKEIIRTEVNPSLSLLRTIKDDSFLARIKEVADEVGIAVFDHSVLENVKGIFPSTIKYDVDLNRQVDGQWQGPVAAASPIDFNPKYKSKSVKYEVFKGDKKSKRSLTRGNIVVGDQWLDMASSSDINRRNRAVRKLIHEKLHLQIHNNVEYGSQFYKDVQEVYEIFNKELQKKIKETNNAELKKLSKLFLNYNQNVRLEEFIVEAMTNKVLFDFLNTIQVEDVKNNKTESLFSKIINFITKLFGWEIKDNSLYQKLYNVLSEELTDERRLGINDFNLDAIDKKRVDVEMVKEPWKDDASKINKKLRIYIKGNRDKGYFELVKDQELGQFSVHFKTGNADTKEMYGSTKEERKVLFEELVKAIPEGATVSTWGNISDDGIRALNNVGRNMTKVGERVIKDRNGNDVTIPIFKNVESEKSEFKKPAKLVIKMKPKEQVVEKVEPKEEPKEEPKTEKSYDIEKDTNIESIDDIDFDTTLDSLYEETDLKYEEDRNTINAIEHSISIENKNNFEKLGIEGLIEYKCN